MKKDTENDKHDILISWIIGDAKHLDDNMEDKVMNVILKQQAAPRKGISRSHVIMMAGYGILTLTVLALCLWNKDMFAQLHIFGSDGRSMPEDEYGKYYFMIIAASLLAVLSFVNHWLKSKNNEHASV